MRLGAPDAQSTARRETSQIRLPRTLGDYELLNEIARGGMGVVYRARQVSLNRLVAVKVLLAAQFASDTQRFRREAEVAASLNHPNIVSIYEVGEHDGQPCFSMELIEGRSLAELAREHPLPARRAARLMKTMAEAIHYAHERRLLHRDLKPSNVLVDDFDAPHITDFGLAKRSDGDADLTLTGQVLGTPNYMPPEQADPKRGAAAVVSDVYSLGAILYQLLTGRAPFMAETLTQTLRLVVESEPVSPRLLNPDVPRDLETICLKCLEKEPQRRYASAQELADELGRFLRDEPIRARAITSMAKLSRWCRRKPALALSLGIAITLLLIVAVGSPIALVRIDHERKLAEAARNQEAALRARAETAERQTEQQLFNALLEQARATVRSGELGQRVRSLEAIQRAATISNSVELRREAIGALALPDLRFERELPFGSEFTWRELDPAFERIALARVEVRATAGQRLLATLAASTNWPVYDMKWSSDGRFLAVKRDHPTESARADWEIWEVADARRAFVARDVSVGAIAFHPTLPQLIFGLRPDVAAIRNLDNDCEIAQFQFDGAPIHLRFAPEGQRFAAVSSVYGGRRLSVHDATTGALLASNVFGSFVRDFQWHPEGRWLAVPDDSGAVHSMNADTGWSRSLGRHRSTAASIVFSPDGAWLLSGSWDGDLICWDARAQQRALTLSLDSYRARFRADSRVCAVMRESGIHSYRIENPTGFREFAEELGGRLRHASFSADGRWLAVSGDKRAAVWNLPSGGPPAIAKEAYDAHFFFTPDGGELFGSRSKVDEDNCFRWRITSAPDADAPPNLVRLPLRKPEGFTFLGLSSNSVVMTGVKGSQILAPEELESGKRQWARTAAGLSRVSPDGRWLGIFRPFSSSLYVYGLPGLERVAKLAHPVDVWNFEFSPHGNQIAVYSTRALELWSTETWQRTRSLTNFGRLLYATDARAAWLERDSRTAGLYDKQTLEPLLLLPLGMLPMAVSADGRQLAVKVDGRRLQVWDMDELRRQLRDLGLDWGKK